MKKVFILLVVLVSCKERTDRVMTVDQVDSVTTAIVARIDAIKGGPTKRFKVLVKFLDSLGYSSDTARVKQVKNYKELLSCKILLVGGFPFYKIREENTKVLSWNSIAREKTDSLDVGVFNQAESVWGYFYGKKESDGMTVDGVIEQWKFPNAETAQIAVEKLKACYPLPYFNTEPYYFVEEHFLFIFHTRASAFSYTQKNFFTKFKEFSSGPTRSIE